MSRSFVSGLVGTSQAGGGTMSGAEIVAALDGSDLSSIGDHLAAGTRDAMASGFVAGTAIDTRASQWFYDMAIALHSDLSVDQTITAIAQTIQHDNNGAQVMVTVLDADGNYTLTDTPSILAGEFDGQILLLRKTLNTANTIIIQDESNLPGSGMKDHKFGGSNIIIVNSASTRVFRWSAGDSRWDCIG